MERAQVPDVAHTAHDMISGMTPTLKPGIFVFITTGDTALITSLSAQAISTFQEEEGMSLLVPVDVKQPENSRFRRSKVGEQSTNLQTLVMNEGPAGGRSFAIGPRTTVEC